MAKEIVSKEPDKKYRGQPCSVTCVGTAYDHIHTWPFTIIKPKGMRYDGYLRLRDMNQFAREYLPIAKRIDFKKNERPRLKEFLQTNEIRCCICVLGHYLYADAQTYWSFFDNDDDKVIAVWYLRVPSAGNMKKWKRYTIKKHLRNIWIVAERLMARCRYWTRTLQSILLRQVQELWYLGISRLKGGGNHGSQKG